MNYYSEIPRLGNIYLEDSYVLDMHLTYEVFSMVIDTVLEPAHHLYVRPNNPKANCFRKMTVAFQPVNEFHWTGRKAPPSHDPDGSIDYGNVDSFNFEGNTFHLEGSFGEITIQASQVVVEFEQDRVGGSADSK